MTQWTSFHCKKSVFSEGDSIIISVSVDGLSWNDLRGKLLAIDAVIKNLMRPSDAYTPWNWVSIGSIDGLFADPRWVITCAELLITVDFVYSFIKSFKMRTPKRKHKKTNEPNKFACPMFIMNQQSTDWGNVVKYH